MKPLLYDYVADISRAGDVQYPYAYDYFYICDLVVMYVFFWVLLLWNLLGAYEVVFVVERMKSVGGVKLVGRAEAPPLGALFVHGGGIPHPRALELGCFDMRFEAGLCFHDPVYTKT